MRFYNSRTRSVEPFAPHEPGHVRIYVCGLTPSAQAHLGHARSFLFFDVLRRYLVYRGYRVTYVQNVTDIDDRSIAAANAAGRPWKDVVEEYYASFTASMRKLGVAPPDREPRATEFIDDIVAMIAALVERGHAYVAEDAVYFSVASFARYGELSGRNVEELLVGARVAAGEHKADPLDFALWKFARPGEPSWPAPWGEGRPGWHIECSAMSQAILDVPLDIHGGGMDLIFPHHENEIAQSESLSTVPLARFWIHGGLLLFDGRKMSKSLGNFEPMSDLLARHDPQAVRLLFLQTGYRKPMNFTEEALTSATSALRRLRDAAGALAAAGGDAAATEPAVEKMHERFTNALDDDMNTSLALSVLFELVADARGFIEAKTAAPAHRFLLTGLELLGIPYAETAPPSTSLPADFTARLVAAVAAAGEPPVDGLDPAVTPEDAIATTLTARTAARGDRNYPRSDRLRDALASLGVLVKDDRNGTTWSLQ